MRPGGVGAGLIAVCLWGLAPVATRSLVSELAPLPLLTLRQLLAAGVLLPWAVPALRRIDARDLPRLIAAGLLGMVGYNLPVTVGLQWLPASSAGLLLATEPVWVLVIGLVFLAERAGLRIVLGTGVALAGVAVIAGPAALSPGSGTRAAAGAALVLLATLAFGGYTVVLRPLSEKYGPVSATAASSVAGALPYLALVGTICRRRGCPHRPGARCCSSPLAARSPGCCCGIARSSAAAAPGSAGCCTWSRWSACWARWSSSASGRPRPSWPAGCS